MGLKHLEEGSNSVETTCETKETEICLKDLEVHFQKDTTVNSLEELIKKLHTEFDNDVIDVDYVTEIMENYKTNPQEWRKYAKFDRYRYTRNLVDTGNGKYNLMLVCWGEGHGSAIHDHADSHCFMKMLQGSLCEVRFAWPEVTNKTETDGNLTQQITQGDSDEVQEMKETRRTIANTNEVIYMNDSLGLHRVENPSHVDSAVSLHLYCPPYDECFVFNQKNGHRTKCKTTFWSKYGERRDKVIQDQREPEDN